MKPCDTHDTGTCQRISEMLSRIGDKWTLLVVRALGHGPRRFSALRRELGSISQKMLTRTLRNLEREINSLKAKYGHLQEFADLMSEAAS